MATISASTPISSITHPTLVHKRSSGNSFSPVIGLQLQAMAGKGRVRCSMEEKKCVEENGWKSGSFMTAVSVFGATMPTSPALGLVDERMSTEGTGLPFGLSNNLLGWILLGVFGLIWALYIVYTSDLDEDEDSGLSL